MKKFLIYTGPVQSGKSSRLLSFVQNRKDVCGILSPLIDGRKYLYDISSGERRLLEANSEDADTDVITTGRYIFNKKVFYWGRKVLQNASKKNCNYLIIDEIGHLELNGKGLSPIVDEILLEKNPSISYLIVVRDTLFQKFLEHYNLKPEDIEFFSLV